MPLVQDEQARKAIEDVKKEKMVHMEKAELVNKNFAKARHGVAVYERWRELALKKMIEKWQAYEAQI